MLPQPGTLIVSGQLNAVAALPDAGVWAVGTTSLGNAVSMHGNGNSWTEVLTPAGDRPDTPGGDFEAVAAVSAGDVWAVGVSSGESLTERWNGTA